MIARNTETTSPHLAVRTVTRQKVKHEQPAVQGGHPPGVPNVTEFLTYQSYTQVELVDVGKQFWLKQGETSQLGFSDSRIQGLAQHLGGIVCPY